MISSFGSPKSSSGSTPSESSGSAPDESSSGSSGYLDSSSSVASESSGSGSSGSSGSSPSDSCSYYIATVLYGGQDDRMEVFLFNDGPVDVTISGITTSVPVTTTPALPITMLPGTGASFTVDAAGNDLRGVTFTVQTSCGDQSGTFPIP